MSAHHFKITKGLDLPITGEPDQTVDPAGVVSRVAILGPDYVGMRPTMAVAEGDRVLRGQVLFTDKKTPGVTFTSPGAGTVEAIHRGRKRALRSVVIRLDGDGEVSFDVPGNPQDLTREQLVDLFVRSGLWTSFRTRPYSRVPAIDHTPRSIFVSGLDTNPHAPRPRVAILRKPAEFRLGLAALTKLTEGKVFFTTRAGTEIPGTDTPGITHVTIDGPHPAGLVGTQIHLLDPVSAQSRVWHMGYQDVISIGSLLSTGRLDVERIVSLAGPAAKRPRLLLTRLGASIAELIEGEVSEPTREYRAISGSILAGTACEPETADSLGYLGRYDLQVSLLREGRERELFGWHGLGVDKFSIKNVFLSALRRSSQRFPMTTMVHGSPRAMVPIGSFERIMPMDILPTFLLRSLLSHDTDLAQQLGALELDEEDLGLCTFVCPGKTEYGPLLREALTTIERDG